MTLKECITAWNAQSDDYNQWESLDCDEKLEWVLKCCNEECADLTDQISLDAWIERLNPKKIRKIFA